MAKATPDVPKTAAPAELRATIDSIVMEKRVIKSDLADPARVQREVDRLEARIAHDQRTVEQYRSRITDGAQRLKDCDARIAELRRDLAIAENKVKIQRLIDLSSQLTS